MMRRILIVGLGSIGRRHLRIIRESVPNGNFAALRRSEDCNTEGVLCFTSLEQALAFKPEIAIIANPAPFHVSTALPFARNGCHLLIEKPLSATSDGVIELIEAANESGAVIQVGYNLRFSRSLRKFRKEIQASLIGEVLSIRCEVGQHLEAWRPGSDYRMGVSARRELGGGVLLELSHEIDYLRWIFGEPEWVSAWTGTKGILGIDVEDTAHLLMGLAASSEGAPDLGPVVCLSLDFIRRDHTRKCTAIGEKGTLVWDSISGTVKLHDTKQCSPELLFQYNPPRDHVYREQWKSFISCIEKKISPKVSGSDGLAALNIIDFARLSCVAQGKRVSITQQGLKAANHG